MKKKKKDRACLKCKHPVRLHTDWGCQCGGCDCKLTHKAKDQTRRV